MAGEKMAVSVAPFFLRVALSVTFIWAGLGKLMSEMPVQGESAAALANMGVGSVQARAKTADMPPPVAEPKAPPAKPAAAKPEPAKPAAEKPAKETKPGGPPALVQVIAQQAGVTTARTFVAAEFPQEIRVSALYGIALALHNGAQQTGPDGKAVSFPLVPAVLADGAKPVWLAWLATLTELIGGILILFGLFTRLAALGIACTMATAIWLTQVGPAIQSGNSTLGFLPNHPAFDLVAWQTPLWQLTLLCAALSLLFAGPGGLSMDRVLSGRPVVNKSKPAPAVAK
ncbi:MAG: DoxX family protein [Phycisphaerales bacterium]|nr:DoxX family protein [Planctomycetota bacterium]